MTTPQPHRCISIDHPVDESFGDQMKAYHWDGSSTDVETIGSWLPNGFDFRRAVKVEERTLLVRRLDGALFLAYPDEYLVAGQSGKVAVLSADAFLLAAFGDKSKDGVQL